MAWRIGYQRWESEELWEDAFGRFCAEVDITRVRALIVGIWGDPEDTDPSDVIEALLAVRDRLPALRSVFLGDITDKECKLSRISQTDVTPLLAGFPALEEFGVRAAEGTSLGETLRLRFSALRHDALRRLTVQSSGLPVDVVRGVGRDEPGGARTRWPPATRNDLGGVRHRVLTEQPILIQRPITADDGTAVIGRSEKAVRSMPHDRDNKSRGPSPERPSGEAARGVAAPMAAHRGLATSKRRPWLNPRT
ncbi:hypothetical protein GCM10023195_00320 [Actinoallomurus liliacearum]|uniref:Uncharacterized protein n=1 Tax=Actinoallomurus liliacearum TaxID=1080073 RepID=A0ABP8TA98_9ACTN